MPLVPLSKLLVFNIVDSGTMGIAIAVFLEIGDYDWTGELELSNTIGWLLLVAVPLSLGIQRHLCRGRGSRGPYKYGGRPTRSGVCLSYYDAAKAVLKSKRVVCTARVVEREFESTILCAVEVGTTLRPAPNN